MNKSELVKHISEEAELTKVKAEAALSAIVEGITGALADDEETVLVGFGTFKLSHRKARAGRNPATGEEIQIAASKLPTFKAGKSLKDSVNH